jgi:hypothetical protein
MDAIDGDNADPCELADATTYAEAEGARECEAMLRSRDGFYGWASAVDGWIADLPQNTPCDHAIAMRAAYIRGWETYWENHPADVARAEREAARLAFGDC